METPTAADTTPGTFAAATAVTPAGGGKWTAEIRSGWDIGGNANGGYLLAIAARALLAETGRTDPVTVTGHYLAPGRPGPLTVGTRVLKEGSRFTDAFALLETGGRPLLSVLGSFGDLDQKGADLLVRGAPPELPPPGRCVLIEASDTFPPPFMGNVELHVHPDDIGFATGRPSGIPRVRGWFRLPNGELVDTVALLCALDAFPPTIFNAALPRAWTPTVELTTHVRARPGPGWLRCRFTTRFVTAGFLEEDGEIWDEQGRLIAQSRQLALVPRG